MIEIVSETFTPHWVVDLSNEAYHGDKTAVSSTALRKILKSPASFYSSWNSPPEPMSDAMRLGSIFHMALLEPELFQKLYVLQPNFGDLRSPLTRKKRDEWRSELLPGAVTLTEDEYARIQGMIESVLRRPDICRLLKDSSPEISGFFRDPDTGIKCKIRPDLFSEDYMALIDVKTTLDCTAESFSKSIFKYRYDIQAKMYCEGIHLITGQPVKYPIYLAVESKPPYECALYLADDPMLLKAEASYRYCLNRLYECLTNNNWPSYQDSIQPISLPSWALNE